MNLKLVLFASILYYFLVYAEEVRVVDRYKYLFSVPYKATWFGAYQYCRYRGMFLIDIPTVYEQQRVTQLIANLAPPYNQTNYWTGGIDLDREGYFVWVPSGHPFVYTNWGSINPNNGYHDEYKETENCVEVRSDYSPFDYQWNDHACHQPNYFICRNTTISPLIIL